MYKRYNLTLKQEFFGKGFEKYKKIGLSSYEGFKGGIAQAIDSFKNEDEFLDATKMQANWFPAMPSSIFLSHSHKDINLAIAFAGWIRKYFGLSVFIDSCIWGNSRKLQRLLDNKYCWMPEKKVYNYNLRNLTTSHVHMMLESSLAHMIDLSECIIFLNTPNSILPDEVVNMTLSPWIFNELTMTSFVRIRDASTHRSILNEQRGCVGSDIEPTPQFEYKVPIDDLERLDDSMLNKWKHIFYSLKHQRKYVHPLDILYHIR